MAEVTSAQGYAFISPTAYLPRSELRGIFSGSARGATEDTGIMATKSTTKAPKGTHVVPDGATRLCACGCGTPLPATAGPKTRLIRGHIRTLEGNVGRALVTGEPLVIYGVTRDPADMVRTGEVKASQLPLAAREKLGALGVSLPGLDTRKTPVNLRPIPADTVKPGKSSDGRSSGNEGVTVFGAIPASEVADCAAIVSSKLYGMEALAESSPSPRIQGYAEGFADAWEQVRRMLARHEES